MEAPAPPIRSTNRAETHFGQPPESAATMVFQYVLPAMVLFGFIMLSAYAGALRALDVYFDPEQDSIFLQNGGRPPDRGRER